MSIEAWKSIAERFGRKYSVAIYIGGSKAYSTESAIYLPGDVPPAMMDAVHGLFLHEKEHIIQKDHDFTKAQDKTLSHALNIVQDIHNDSLVLEQDRGAEGLYRTITEYIMAKHPQELRDAYHWKQKAMLELLNRGLPRSVSEGYHYTNDPQVKHFFKKYRREIGKLLKDMKDLRPKRVEQVKWSKWLIEKLFDDIIDSDLLAALGGGAIPKSVMEQISAQIEAMGGLTPQGMSMNFECISPGDLFQKVPEAVTVQRLKEFLSEKMEQEVTTDDGGIDPTKLPTYWNGDDDIFVADKHKNEKKVRVHLMLDASYSMTKELTDGKKRFEALCRATGLVCQAVERVKRDNGMDIELEAWAFGCSDRLVKKGGDRWDPYEFKKAYWLGGDSGTYLGGVVEKVNACADEETTRDVCIVITDGELQAEDRSKLEEVQAGKKKWILIGIGSDLNDKKLFRFVANSLDEIEYILCQTIKEATV